jgi:serine/threonine protein kinase
VTDLQTPREPPTATPLSNPDDRLSSYISNTVSLKRSYSDAEILEISSMLKALNILYTDFGLAHDLADATGSTTSRITPLSPRYCAPQVTSYESRNRSSDIRGLGCEFLEIVVLKLFPTDYMNEFIVANGIELPFIRTHVEPFSRFATELEGDDMTKDNRAPGWAPT